MKGNYARLMLKTILQVGEEYWNASRGTIKPIYFDENKFTVEQPNVLEQAFNDLENTVEREITLKTAKGLIITREYVSRIIDQFFNKVPEQKKKHLTNILNAS